MYTEYFKLNEPPFSLTPDPRYLFMSERHREGLAHLFYGVQQPGGFVQLTGEIGSGKTTLSRCLVRQLPHDTDVALILNPRLTAIELLATVCDELQIPYPAETQSIKVLIDALNKHLLKSHDQHRRTVLIIDESQNLSGDVLEQIRLLTNLETSQEKLLQIILIGQPELLTVLKSAELKQIAQRITARYHLLALSRQETYAYIRHRLLVAGRKDPLFTDSAMRCIYRLSAGMPRVINILCDRSLLGAYALDKRQVTAAIVRRASRETRGAVPLPRRLRFDWLLSLVGLLALVATGAILFHSTGLRFWRQDKTALHPAQNSAAKIRGTAPKSSGQTVKADPLNAADPPKPELRANPGPEILKKLPLYGTDATTAPSKTRLIDLLSDPSRGALSAAFSDLYARWGIQYPLSPSELGCKTAQAHGFECLFLVGGWPRLRRFDIPAILEILLPTVNRKRVTLTGLSGETATLSIGGHEYSFPVSEIDQVWDGSSIILWKPPFPPPYQLAPGAQGTGVAWVRRTLDSLDKRQPAADGSDIYDDELRRRILSFQRNRALIQDGLVGNETLVRLTLALEGSSAPSLSKGTR
jgi:general secretion pathway protein A